MATLHDLLAEHTDLSDAAAQHLQRLVAEWQLLADLSFADYVMAVRGEDGRLVYVAQVRPNTTSTLFQHDEVGHAVDSTATPYGGNPLVARAYTRGCIERDDVPRRHGGVLIERIAVPVRYGDEVIAVLGLAGVVTGTLPPSPLESAYRDAAGALRQMVLEGTFPLDEANTLGLSTPRAGDGFIRLDGDGRVVYASPNAVSAVHRMGWKAELGHARLADAFAELLTDPFDAADVSTMLDAACIGTEGRSGSGSRIGENGLPTADMPLRMELDAKRASVLVRVVPLRSGGQTRGAVLLIRDVTEVKRRDLALISKDATIREIHHRVKNNLQSVSALLRLQARRSGNPETITALTEAVRRVSSIALVHEMLSGSVDEEVDLDAVVDRLIPTLVDVGAPGQGSESVSVRRGSRLGVLPADLAMPLVQVLTEVVQNSIEHGFAEDPGDTASRTRLRDGAQIVVDGERDLRGLTVRVTDNGAGVPAGFDLAASNRLGLQIVRTLVNNDLGGTIDITPGDDGGTVVELQIPLH
ncbi:MAG: histidine kinase N-terminal domain-containing protein [Gordonia sp. (in: high G+C Gram-positive bacteria)]|uniref:sensor histidine kinase n=1 Tax=Gordonia sp. (in: high G+C Gram-positive bacteria) TaxID=84139 RepID=UPI0039E64761